jgi:hypothetical protein
MRKIILVLCLIVVLGQSGCSLNWLFNVFFDNPHAGGNGSAADRARTLEWESSVADEWIREREMEELNEQYRQLKDR